VNSGRKWSRRPRVAHVARRSSGTYLPIPSSRFKRRFFNVKKYGDMKMKYERTIENCQFCGFDLVGKPIPKEMRDYYSAMWERSD
jgi:hypothetical protein